MTTSPYNASVFVPVVAQPVDHRTAMVQELKAGLSYLPARDQEFAKSLIQSFNQYGLSEKQGYWVVKLLERIDEAKAPPAPIAAPAAPTTVALDPGFAKIIELFNRAVTAGLKSPKIRLETSTGRKVILRRAGSTSKYAGQITVTDNGTSFETRTYFGRITLEGQYFPSNEQADVTQLLKDMATDPVKMAALYGFKTSNCCFCGLHLKTSESVTMGYGPICAEKFGMPWGQHVETTYTKITLEDAE
jgi:hypothetical protein